MMEMVSPGEETGISTIFFPSPTQRLHGNRQVISHGLHRLQHLSCDVPVRFTLYSEVAAAFITLHSDNTARLYKADGHKHTSPAHLPFLGLTATKIAGCLLGWGPGSIFTLLDSDLRPLETAWDALDVRVCQAAEHSTEVVTAGVGNVCVWSVVLMRCKVKIQEELQHSTFTHMALAPPRADRPHRGFVVCGRVVTVVDLEAGTVLEHRRDICSRDITAIVYCSQLDCLITASRELSIRIWGPDWDLRFTFVGHNGLVNSLFHCPASSMLFSSSVDGTIRCWNVEQGEPVECVHTEQENPPLCIFGTKKGDCFFSSSHSGVDIWTMRTLYTLHSELGSAPLRQIVVPSTPAPYPTRVLCLSGDSDVTLVAAETGKPLTSFWAKQKIVCADYCLQRETLLALTDTGTLLQANTLTNPITLMQEWEGRGQEPWQHLADSDAQNLSPGPACCLMLFSHVADTQAALEEWNSLQERRGCSQRDGTAVGDDKNKFLIILGQSGGCISVLTLHDGTVVYRTPAHRGQTVTRVQAYPENSYLFSIGEDMTVVVWRVNPFVQECLSQHMRVPCSQSHVYLAALGPRVALTVQELSGNYNLTQFNLNNQSSSTHAPQDGHSEDFTGLCACPDLEVFVSSSQDGTVCVWNKENHLIRTLQLNAVAECLAYGGCGRELFLGIRGDLYRIDCAKFLPHKYQQMLPSTHRAEALPDTPIIQNKDNNSKRKNASTEDEEDKDTNTSNLLPTEDPRRHKEYRHTVDTNMDLFALLRGSVKCQRGKPPRTKETKKEAFDCYMEILYGSPFNIKIDCEDTYEADEFHESSFFTRDYKPHNLPALQEDIRPESRVKTPKDVENKTEKKVPATMCKPKTLMKDKLRPVVPTKTITMEKHKEPPEIIPLMEQPKTPHCPKSSTPPTPRPTTLQETTPEVPAYLKRFADAGWFKELYPDKKCIPSTLSPEDFCLQLLGCLNTCSAPSRMSILAALKALHSGGLLHNTDTLYQDLVDLVPTFVRPHMSPVERAALVAMLSLLVGLKSASCEFVKTLLTLLAFKKLALRETLLGMLTALSVDEAELWLWPELEGWDSELQDQSHIWRSLYDRAKSWLELWISKYKEHNRHLYLRGTAKWKPLTLSVVDVLNYFCSVRKDEYRKARCVAPAGRKDTVLLPVYDCSSEPILRLGETYSMARIWRPQGLILPPLRERPFLMNFPSSITLPLPRVTLSPFHPSSEEDWLKALSHHYFIPQQACVEYYR